MFYTMIILGVQLIVIVCVGICGICTVADEPKCPFGYIDQRILEKVISLEMKTDKTLETLEKMKESQDGKKPSSLRLAPSPAFTDALRVEDLEYDGWQLVFRATAGNGHNVYNAWTKGQGTSDTKPETMERSNPCNFRSNVVSAWTTLQIEKVKLALYARDMEVAYVVFNGQGSDSNNWFQASRVIASSWPDLTNGHSYNFFSIDGDSGLKRRFFINRSYNGCANDLGHIAVLDTDTVVRCNWDRQPVYPQFGYSRINSVDYWNTMQFGRADFLAIFIKTA